MMRRALAIVGIAGISALAGCGGAKNAKTTGRPETPAPTLAQRLNAMPAPERLSYLRGMQKERPGDAVVAFHFGNAYYSIGTSYPPEDNDRAFAYYDSAVAAYTRAVEIDSTYSKAYVNMGLAYEAWGKRPDARRVLRTAVEVNPDDVLAHCHLGQLEQSFGNYAEAVSLYRRALVLDPNSAQAHYNLGLAFAEQKVFKEALLEWQTVITLDPDGELGKTATENVRIIQQYIEASP